MKGIILAGGRGFITLEALKVIGESLKTTDYGKYILTLCEKDVL